MATEKTYKAGDIVLCKKQVSYEEYKLYCEVNNIKIEQPTTAIAYSGTTYCFFIEVKARIVKVEVQITNNSVLCSDGSIEGRDYKTTTYTCIDYLLPLNEIDLDFLDSFNTSRIVELIKAYK